MYASFRARAEDEFSEFWCAVPRTKGAGPVPLMVLKL